MYVYVGVRDMYRNEFVPTTNDCVINFTLGAVVHVYGYFLHDFGCLQIKVKLNWI